MTETKHRRPARRTLAHGQPLRRPMARRTPQRRPTAGQRPRPAVGRLWQLVVCGALLLGVVAIKLTAPDTLEPYRQRLLTLMGGDTDFTAAFVWLASPLLLGAILSAAVCHELGHWLVLRRVGGRIQRLHITVFGAEMQVDDRRISYGGELLTAAAGPVINLLLAAAMGLLGRWWEPLYLFAGAQLVLGAFNLLPALPLDGGRILWLALAWLTEPYTAQRVLSAVSLAVSLALLLGGGWFIWRLGGSPFLLVGAVGLTGWNLREIKLAKGG